MNTTRVSNSLDPGPNCLQKMFYLSKIYLEMQYSLKIERPFEMGKEQESDSLSSFFFFSSIGHFAS